jgi:hypothetical protein
LEAAAREEAGLKFPSRTRACGGVGVEGVGPLQLTRFNPGNAHVCGLSIHGALVGSDELDDDQTKAEGHRILPRFGPLGRVMTYVLLV